MGSEMCIRDSDDHLASYADRIFHIRDGKILKIEETNQKREDEEYEHEGN